MHSLHAGHAEEHIDHNTLLLLFACSRDMLQVVSLLGQVVKCTHACKQAAGMIKSTYIL